MTLAELAAVAEVERLTLRPGDVLVLKYPMRLSADDMDYIKEKVDQVWPDQHVKVLICEAGSDVAVLRAEAAAPAATEQPAAPVAHGTDDCFPYGGSWDEGREYRITCHCGAEFTGENDGMVENEFQGHLDRVEAGEEVSDGRDAAQRDDPLPSLH